MNSLLNQRLLIAVLTAIAAVLTNTGILPKEISDAHIAQIATLVMAFAAIYLHAHANGAATGTASASTAITNAAKGVAEDAASAAFHAVLGALEQHTATIAAAAAPAPAAPAPASPAPAVTNAVEAAHEPAPAPTA